MTPHTPGPQAPPFIWLQEREPDGTAACGCHLTNYDTPQFYQCPTHAAAPEMLAGWQDTSIDEVVALLETVKQQTDEGRRRVAKGVYENIHRALTSARHVQATRAALLARIEGKA